MTDYPAILREVAKRRPKHAARLEAHARLLEQTPEPKRPNIAHALAFLHPEYPWRGELVSPYPLAAARYQARIILGQSPAEITGLTAAEAHEYLSAPWSARDCEPADWLVTVVDMDADINCGVHDVPTARWIIECMRDPPRRAALIRTRVERGPGGEIRGSYWNRVDELTAKDLRASVEATFRAAGTRLWKQTERLLAKDHKYLCDLPHWWQPLRCARVLRRASELVIEGREMRHCVAQYAPLIARGQCIIIALNVRGHRSTVELTRDGQLRQHRGRDNEPPHETCNRVLACILERFAP